jgi:hypothetical protein
MRLTHKEIAKAYRLRSHTPSGKSPLARNEGIGRKIVIKISQKCVL